MMTWHWQRTQLKWRPEKYIEIPAVENWKKGRISEILIWLVRKHGWDVVLDV